MKSLPAQTIRVSHAAQKGLDMLDAGLFLAWNARLERYEVWREERSARGVEVGFILRCSYPDGGYAEPSASWVMDQLRRRDSRTNSVRDAAEEALRDMRERERAEQVALEKREDEIIGEIAREYTPLWRQKADPHWTTKRYVEWDPEPVQIPTAKSKREEIRDLARSA